MKSMFQVCCDNMKGVEKGLDWVLHHLAKRRREWQYHMKQGQSWDWSCAEILTNLLYFEMLWNVINILLALFLQIISFHFSRKNVKTWMRPRMKLWRKSSIIISCMTALLLMFSSITLWSVCSQSQTLHPGKDVWQKGIFS